MFAICLQRGRLLACLPVYPTSCLAVCVSVIVCAHAYSAQDMGTQWYAMVRVSVC